MYSPAQHTEEEVVPVVHELSVSCHHAIQQRGLERFATVQNALVEDETEYEHQLVHHLRNAVWSG